MLAACGVQAYRVALCSAHEAPLVGSIKQCPEDFVVIEVDPVGQCTDDANYRFDLLLREEDTADMQLNDETTTTVEATSCEMSLEDMRALVESHEAALLQTLGTREQVVTQAEQLSDKALTALVTHIRDHKGSAQATEDSEVAQQSTSTWWWTKTYTLPHTTSLDKAQRRMLHSVISSSFTHIRSRAAATSDVVVAFVDPHYVFFCYLCGPDVADQLAWWAATQRSATANTSNDTTAQSTIDRTRLDTSFRHDTSEQVSDTLSGKELRRVFHAVLRRFYPYVRCHVTEGRVTLQYTGPNNQHHHTQASKRLRDEECNSHNSEQISSSTSLAKMYCQMIVKKRNLDTAEMRTLLAAHFAVPETSVCCAGMKDKVAVSYQRCSIPGTPTSTSIVSDTSESPDVQSLRSVPVHLGWPGDETRSYCDVIHRSAPLFRAPVAVGRLKGNAFRIRLRGLRLATQKDDNAISVLRHRLARLIRCGFVNYFGQQRFSESIGALRDHTGLHLFKQDWVAAVRSLYRGCPELYDGFPARMEGRYAPGNARDVRCMTHALRQTYRMYFSEHILSSDDIQEETPLWQAVCQKAICEAVPFALRALWVHAAQSLVFNVAATFVMNYLHEHKLQHSKENCEAECATDADDKALPAQWQEMCLPLGGYSITEAPSSTAHNNTSDDDDDDDVRVVREAAMQHTLHTLGLTAAQLLEQRKVAGVPVPGSWRALFVLPRDVTLIVHDDSSDASEGTDVTLDFFLPSSSYATIFLRELLYNDAWW